MPTRIPQERWDELIKEHVEGGRRICDILKDNPDVKKSNLQGRIKKANQAATQQDPPVDTVEGAEEPSRPKTTVKIRAKKTASVEEQGLPPVRPVAPPATVKDDFLSSVAPERFRGPGPSLDTRFGAPQGPHSSLADRLFSADDIFGQEAVTRPVKQEANTKSSKPALGKGYSFWTKLPKEEKTKEKVLLEDDNERLVLVQKIRLYFLHFPELEKLHIVPRKPKRKSDGDNPPDVPDVDKFMLSLYDKKVDDLLKIVNLIRFHVRNTINENSSVRLANNLLETSVKVLEHTLFLIGVQSQDLTKSVMEDQDIQRCVKEILIDHSITPVNLGPKSDLALKLGMKIVSTDSQNRIDRKLEQLAREKKEKKESAPGPPPPPAPAPQQSTTTKPMSAALVDKYKDL